MTDFLIKDPERLTLHWNAGERGLPGVDATAVMLEDRWWEISGTNAVDADATYLDDHGVQLETNGGGADQVILHPSADADNRSPVREYNWGPENSTIFEAVIRTGAWANSVIFGAGWTLTHPATFVTGDDNDRIMFRAIQGTDTYWTAVVNIGGTDHLAVSTVPVLATTRYHLKIETDEHGRATFSVNGVPFYTSPQCTAGAALLPHVFVEEASAAAKTIVVSKIALSRKWGVN
jgi:hypothetical protein